MNEHFTPIELKLMKGKYASLARKYDVSTSYVKLIANGKRKVHTRLSRMILSDIRNIVELFTPLSESELKDIKTGK